MNFTDVADEGRRLQLRCYFTELSTEADVTLARVTVETIDAHAELTRMIGAVVEIDRAIAALPAQGAFASREQPMAR